MRDLYSTSGRAAHTNADHPITSAASNQRPRVAIIGGGIAGLTACFQLHSSYSVTLFEANPRLGGHTDTHTLTIEGQTHNVDSGFIIFCPEYYPNFSAMLDELQVASQPTDMSFSAHNPDRGVVYNATSLDKLFCDRKNIVRPSFWRMLFDIVRFYSRAKKHAAKDTNAQLTVGEYLTRYRYGRGFAEDHLKPMISALWSVNWRQVSDYPIRHLIEFFDNHGLLKLIGRPQWKVVKNGSKSYIDALVKAVDCEWQIGNAVTGVVRREDGITVMDQQGISREFEAVVFATHADQVLSILSDTTELEHGILGAITFEQNHVVVHTDDSIMPTNRKAWASWNTRVPSANEQNSLNCCTANYWMNSLQNLACKTNIFTTLNSTAQIAQEKILAERFYAHPIFTPTSVAAQKRLPEINGLNRCYYAGAYWGWGFHEDGARSALHAADLLKQHMGSSKPTERVSS